MCSSLVIAQDLSYDYVVVQVTKRDQLCVRLRRYSFTCYNCQHDTVKLGHSISVCENCKVCYPFRLYTEKLIFEDNLSGSITGDDFYCKFCKAFTEKEVRINGGQLSCAVCKVGPLSLEEVSRQGKVFRVYTPLAGVWCFGCLHFMAVTNERAGCWECKSCGEPLLCSGYGHYVDKLKYLVGKYRL